MTDYARRTARVLVIDREERVLLLHYGAGDDRTVWLAPGGGLDEGESLREAAARELAEEIGLSVAVDDLGPHVAYAEGYADLGPIAGVMRDDYFVHRVDEHAVDIAGMLDHEIDNLLGHRWWTAADLIASGEDIVPRGLAGLLTKLTGARSAPVRLPWHH